jgi:hypothetical protein
LKQRLQEVVRQIEQEVTQKNERIEVHIEAVRSQMMARIEREVQDKVRVEEVQDALRRLNEGIGMKVDAMEERVIRSMMVK